MNFINTFHLSNNTYDKIKYVVLYFIPAVGFFTGFVGKVWDIPTLLTVCVTILGFGLALCIALGISTKNYKQLVSELTNDQVAELIDRFGMPEEYEEEDDDDLES